MNDEFEFLHRIKVQAMHHAESRAKRRSNQTGTRRRSDQGEAAKIQTMRAGAGPWPMMMSSL